MFTIALAFIIFVGTSFALQGHSIADNIELGIGADIVVLAVQQRFPVDRIAMSAYLDEELARRRAGDLNAKVLGYSYETYPLDAYTMVVRTEISNLAGYPSQRCRIVGFDEHYVDETYKKNIIGFHWVYVYVKFVCLFVCFVFF